MRINDLQGKNYMPRHYNRNMRLRRIIFTKFEELLDNIPNWGKDVLVNIYVEGRYKGYIFITKDGFFYAFYENERGLDALERILSIQKRMNFEIITNVLHKDVEGKLPCSFMKYIQEAF